MNKLFAGLVFISSLLVTKYAIACSCVGTKGQGFSSEIETSVLPRNAKGVLFTRYEFDSQEQLKNADFLILNQTTQKKIAAKVVKLNLDFTPTKKGPSFTKTIYRIEPVKPLTPGHSYQFSYLIKRDLGNTNSSQTVSISSKLLPIESLSKVSFKFIDKAEIRTLSVDGSSMCREYIDALVQEIIYEFPPELKEFRDSILLFTAYSDDSKNFNVWLYRRSVCDSIPIGRSTYAFGHDLINIPAEDREGSQLKRGVQYNIKGTWIVPEIEDKLYSSRQYALSYSK